VQGLRACSEKNLRGADLVKKGLSQSNSNNLLDGDYDERESRASFHEALMEWRQMKPAGKGEY